MKSLGMSVTVMTMKKKLHNFSNRRNALISATTIGIVSSEADKGFNFFIEVLLFNRKASSAGGQLSSPKQVPSRPTEYDTGQTGLPGANERGFSLNTMHFWAERGSLQADRALSSTAHSDR